MAADEKREWEVMRRRIAVVAGTVALLIAQGGVTAWSDETVDVGGGPSIDVEIESDGSSDPDDGTTGTGVTDEPDGNTGDVGLLPCEDDPGGGGGEAGGCGIAPGPDDEGGIDLPPVDPADLGQSVLDTMYLPSPRVSISPGPPNPTYVNLWTWFWIPQSQWVTKSKSVTLRGTTVTVTVTPETATWDSGEGRSTCSGPGEEWVKGAPEASSCGHRYESTGTVTVSASIGWHATWTCSGVCIADGGDLGVLEADAGSVQLEVRQRQSLVID